MLVEEFGNQLGISKMTEELQPITLSKRGNVTHFCRPINHRLSVEPEWPVDIELFISTNYDDVRGLRL